MPRNYKLVAQALASVALAIFSANSSHAQIAASNATSQRAIEDLRLRESVYQLYLQQNLDGIAQLGAAIKRGELPQVRADALLTLAAHHISYGSYTEAAQILEQARLVGADSSRLERLSLDLAMHNYARGEFSRAEKLLLGLAGLAPGSMRSERDYLLANVYIATNRAADAISLLKSMRDDSIWAAYGRYNLAVLLISAGQTQDGAAILMSLTELKSQGAELEALRDRVHLRLGYFRLEEKNYELAKKALMQVSTKSPFYSQALLGLGWAERSRDQMRAALNTWDRLIESSADDLALYEASLGSAYTFNQLQEYEQAVERYKRAIDFCQKELDTLESTIASVDSGEYTRSLFADTPLAAGQGWDIRIESLPVKSGLTSVLPLLASHDFQALLKSHRDLLYLETILQIWGGDLEAFGSLVKARNSLLREKLPSSVNLNKQKDVALLLDKVKQIKNELARIEADMNVFALADEEEMKLIVRVRRSDKLLKRLVGEILDAEDLQKKYQLLRGMLYWNLHGGFIDKLTEMKKAVAELEQAAEAALREQKRLLEASKDSVNGAGGQADIIRELRVRQIHLLSLTKDLLGKSDANMRSQLRGVLKDRRSRINEYLLQAYFGVALAQAFAATRGNDSSKEQAIAAYRKLLEMKGEMPQRREVERYLAQLELEQADINLLKVSETDKQQHNDKSSEASRRITYQDVIKRYRYLVDAYPNDPENEKMLYQLAKAYDRDGDVEGALDALTMLVRKYPGSKLLDEVQFRRGEILFSINLMAEAAQAYAAVMAMGEASSFYEGAVYKHGWSQYRLGQYGKALESFLDLLDKKLGKDAIAVGKKEELNKHDLELINDVLRISSLSLSDQDGAPMLARLFATRGHRPYERRLYERLAELYLEKERVKDAVDTYRAYTTAYPYDPKAPEFDAKILAAYNKAGFTSLLVEAKERFVIDYIPGSNFWQKNPMMERAVVLADVNAYLQELTSHSHARVQASKKTDDYDQAEKWYRLFLKAFPQDKQVPKTNFLLAELLYEAGRYKEAAVEYERTAYDYPAHEKSAEAGYAAVLAHRQQEAQLTGKDRKAVRRLAADSSMRFADKFSGDARAATVITKAAEDTFALQDYDRAAEIARVIVDTKFPADAHQRRTAWTIIAHIKFEKHDYPGAEESYKQLLRLIAKNDAEYEAMLDRLAASVYKQGEKAQADNDLKLAIKHFLRVGEVAPESTIQPTAEYDAAAALITMHDWRSAIKVLENFRKSYPAHTLQSEVPSKLALAYLEDGQHYKAAIELESLAQTGAREDLRREALLQAADLYSKAERSADMARIYEYYVRQYPRPLTKAVEVRQRLAEYYSREKHTEKYRYWLQEIIAADHDGGLERSERTQYLASMAALVLAAVAYEEYSQIRLVDPLETNLKAKKEKMEAALTAYSRSAQYSSAEITTASTYHIAQIYADFGRELMSSERPRNLSAEELEQYNILLEEQANPFEEKAIEVYEVNARRAADDIYDEWVKKSFSALRRLMPARYDKIEQGEMYVEKFN